MDIIYYTLFPWENAYSSVSLSFAKEFSKNNRVFYINKPYSFKDFYHERKTPLARTRATGLWRNKLLYEEGPGISDNIIFAMPPMTVPINWLPPGKLYDYLSTYNSKLIYQTVQQVIRDHKIKDFIYLNCFNPFHGAVLPKSMGPRLNIYQCIDDMREETYTARHGVRLEEKAIRQADMVMVTSKELFRLKSGLNKNTYIVHNAVDISIYESVFDRHLSRPPEIARIDNKIIGFMGNMDATRIDYALLKKIATTHKDKTLLLIGPHNSDDIVNFGLDKLHNVILTGGKDIRELPAYVKFMDVAIIPFKCNKLTKSIYPLKINEYLAGGRPTVSTNFSEDIRGFRDCIYLADNHEAFLQSIDRAIAEDSEANIQQRRSVARQNTWSARVTQFWEIVDHQLSGAKVID